MAHARKENFAATGKVAASSKQRVPKNGSECGRTGKKFVHHDMPAASSLLACGLARMTMMTLLLLLLLLEPRWLQRVIDPLKPKVCARKMYKERGRVRRRLSGGSCCSWHTRLSWRGMSTGSQGCYGNIWESTLTRIHTHTDTALSLCTCVRFVSTLRIRVRCSYATLCAAKSHWPTRV